MFSLSHKSNQYISTSLKVLIVLAVLWYLYTKLSHIEVSSYDFLKNRIATHQSSLLFIGFFLALAALNWMLEIKKWHLLANSFTSIGYKEATKQSLASLTVSLLTPNRVGEYGAKALYYKKEKRKRVLLLNFFGNTLQLLTTVLFGIIGLVYLTQQHTLEFSKTHSIILILCVIILVSLGIIFKEKEIIIKGLSLNNILSFFKKINFNTKWLVSVLSVFRYIVFSTLFYIILCFFEVPLSYFEALPYIFSMYLMVSIVPTLFVLDVVVRGGVAVWLFGLAGVSEISVVCTVLLMWFLNFVIPSIIGSFFVLDYKPKTLW